jgi:hypothetical protein
VAWAESECLLQMDRIHSRNFLFARRFFYPLGQPYVTTIGDEEYFPLMSCTSRIFRTLGLVLRRRESLHQRSTGVPTVRRSEPPQPQFRHAW